MAYYRENIQVGWIDEFWRFYGMDTCAVDPELTLTKCYAAVGEWVDDGNDCRFCDRYIGYGPSHTVDGKTACPECPREDYDE